MEIDKKYFRACTKITRFFNRPEWVQGGGGNFSIKIDHRTMLVKASGFSFSEISNRSGLVMVDHESVKKLIEDFNKKPVTPECENIFNEKTNNLVKNIWADQNLHGSIETGFHSFLGKYVVHTHSVFANLVNCSSNPLVLLKSITEGFDNYVFVPYAPPGLALVRAIRKEVGVFKRRHNFLPAVIFLQNHGIIVNSEKLEDCFSLYSEIEKRIKKYFKIKNYPEVKIKSNKNGFISDTRYLKGYFKKTAVSGKTFLPVLFPDQVVYLNGSVKKTGLGLSVNGKIFFGKNGKIFYGTGQKEAKTIEETLTVYVFIKEVSSKNKISLKGISRSSRDFIGKMKSEKYRSALIKK